MVEIIPPELEKYLTKDEIVEQEFKLSDCKVWATNKRVLIKTGRRIQDIDYNHISSIGFERKTYHKLIGMGVIFFIATWILSELGAPEEIITVLCLPGIICIILGVCLRKEWLELIVLGYKEPIKFKGSRQDLDQLFRIIREKRF